MRLFTTILASLILAACARLPQRASLPDESALAPAPHGAIADRVEAAQALHPGQSGFRLVSSGAEAYALRAYSAQAATRSLDIQTYIWHDDLTGRLIALRALEAADRGVRVRVLVDDLDARGKNAAFAALDAHPLVEVRLYNPMASRRGTLAWAGEFGTGFRRLNHRMHNKTWIADNRLALVGGRNLGNEYFGAEDGINFIDLDLLMAGPVVAETSANFDRFWNSPSNYPIAQLAPSAATPARLQQLRVALADIGTELSASPYKAVLREDPAVQAILEGGTRLHWSDRWRFVSDDPLKATLPQAERSAVVNVLLPAMLASRRSVSLISPYFVPGSKGTQHLVDSARRGLEVSVLTNSLATNDVAAVHGGYMRYRAELLRGGVQLWELRPVGGADANFSLAGSSGSALHTKAAVFDDTKVFVGSYNLDPRSTSLNSEQGVLVEHPELAAELIRLFEHEVDGTRAWQVTLVDDELNWSDGSRSWTREPEASTSRRVVAWLMKVLPVESQL
jgi:cardiolipin synthase C